MFGYSPLAPVIIVRMPPRIWRDLARLGQLDHVHWRRAPPLLARPALQRRRKLPDRGVTRAAHRMLLTLAAMPCSDTTVILHRGVKLNLSSLMDRTIPVTGNPSKITVAFSPRNWAKRQRLATFGSVI